MKVPRADDKSKEFFRSMVPNDPRITIRPMFGNISGFVNGNMFAGLFGDDLFVRLSEEKHNELLGNNGAKLLEPMEGRPMKDYIVIPKAWMKQADTVRKWIVLSFDFTSPAHCHLSRKPGDHGALTLSGGQAVTWALA